MRGTRRIMEDAHGIGSIRHKRINYKHGSCSTSNKRITLDVRIDDKDTRGCYCHCILNQCIRGTTSWQIQKASLELKTKVASYGNAINVDRCGEWHVACGRVLEIIEEFVTAGFGATSNQCA